MNTQEHAVTADIIYVFDTSSIRGISFPDLRKAVEIANLAVSPFTIFELLCHIDEKGKFDLFKTNFQKCALLELLNDPYAEQALVVGAESIVNPTRFEDKELLPQLFTALKSSSTLEDFYRQQVYYPTGGIADIRGIASRIRDVLTEEENTYKTYVIKLCNLMLQEFGFKHSQNFTFIEFVKIACNAACLLAQGYEKELQLTKGILNEPVFSKLYPYLGYCIVRGIEYLRRANGSIDALNIEINDTEDSAICLHLSLLKRCILVTNDHGTYQAVKQSFQNLQSASTELHQDVTVLADVINTTEFKQRVIPE